MNLWRLITFIIICGIFLTFISFNLENKCSISFGFTSFSDVPVFITIFFSFILGLFFGLPLALTVRKKRKELLPKKDKKPGNDELPAEIYAEPGSLEKIRQDAASAKERFLARRRGGNDK